MVELLREYVDQADDWQVEPLPHQIVHVHGQTCGIAVTGQRHMHLLARAKRVAAKDAAQGLGKAVGAVLRHHARVGEATVPRRCPAQFVRGYAVYDQRSGSCRGYYEHEERKSVGSGKIVSVRVKYGG